ncbi:MAG: SAM-dependent methyltransferase [Planctomycetota bacterium]
MTSTDDRRPLRNVHTADALAWLAQQPLPARAAVFTSLPDAVELPRSARPGWESWFVDAATAVLRATPDDGAALFFQTDVKRDGRWIDKAFLVQLAARDVGVPLVWHKVVCRAPAGQATFGRVGFAHLLCFGRALRDPVEAATPDVLPELGAMPWPRAMGLAAARFAVDWLCRMAQPSCLVDPFCGVGTALAVANARGLDAIGVEKNPGRAEQARSLAAT